MLVRRRVCPLPNEAFAGGVSPDFERLSTAIANGIRTDRIDANRLELSV
jgi:hypothetical protein